MSTGCLNIQIRQASLDQVMKEFIKCLNDSGHFDFIWRYEFMEPALAVREIPSLALSNLSAHLALSYLTKLTNTGYYLANDHVIRIVPPGFEDPRSLVIEEVDYQFVPDGSNPLWHTRGPHDVRKEIEKRLSDLGFDFQFAPGDSAFYFPKEFRVRVKCSVKNHETVFVCQPTCLILEPTVFEQVQFCWRQTVDKLHPRSLKPAVSGPPASPPSPVPDPFTGDSHSFFWERSVPGIVVSGGITTEQ